MNTALFTETYFHQVRSIENRMVSVNADELIEGMTIPLMSKEKDT
jgi:hypothetical protein